MGRLVRTPQGPPRRVRSAQTEEINVPIQRAPDEAFTISPAAAANVMMRPDHIGGGESTRRAHNAPPRRNRATFGVMIRARHVQFSAENWHFTRQSTQVRDWLM